MNRGEIRSLILQWLDDPQAGYFETSTVNTWINLAQREVQKLLLQAGENYYLQEAQTTTVASQSDYVIPADFMKLHRLEIVVSGTGVNEDRQRIQPLTLNQQERLGVALGTPIAYVLKKDRLTLFPTPDLVKTLRLYYSPRVIDLVNDGDIPDVPEDYHEMIAIIAAKNGFIKDDRTPTTLLEREKEYKELMVQSAEDRKQDQSRSVVITDDYESFGALF